METKGTILIVDDSEAMRKILKVNLEKENYNVHETNSAISAIDIYKKINPDLVIMDIMMPDLSGIEGVKIIKSINPNAKIIMCSARGTGEVVANAVKAGAINFIVKPFNRQKFLDIVKSVLG